VAGDQNETGLDVAQWQQSYMLKMTTLRALKFADGAFDMLLTDIMMPGMDGIELAKQAETLSPGIKIMFITGFAAVAMSDQDASNQTVLSKPVHLRQLVEEVDRLIAA